MKFFPVNPEVDEKIEKIMRQIRHLKNGETAEQIEKSGAHYPVNFGVSLVHLRKMGTELESENALAQRLWYRRIRETMILATMVADYNAMGQEEVNNWGEMLSTIELSEQLGRNFLVKQEVPEKILIDWLKCDHFYKQYAAAMGVGWRIRINGEAGLDDFAGVMVLLEGLAAHSELHRAVGFALKIAGRFLPSFRDAVLDQAGEWQKSSGQRLKQLGKEVKFEIEAFM